MKPMRSTHPLVFLLLLSALLIAIPSVWTHSAAAQGPASPTPDARPTLPATWTPTPTRLPTETPLPTLTFTPTVTPSPTLTATPAAPPPPSAARLEGMQLVWQQYNGCAPAALTMLLRYHDWSGSLTQVTRALRPGSRDVSVRSEEMVAFVEAQGLKAVTRSGGTLELLQRLVADGFPVLVENVYDPGGNWMGHNRIVMGYDDDASVVYTFDSVLGSGPDRKGRPISYDDFDAQWKPFNRTFLVAYAQEDEARVRDILGVQWDLKANAQTALDQARLEILANIEDAYAIFNMGSALLALDRAKEAASAFERAIDLGLPWRFLWYQFGPFEAYLALGRYEDVIALGQKVLQTSAGVEEVYYYLGAAHAARGEHERAEYFHGQALARNGGFAAAEVALQQLADASQ